MHTGSSAPAVEARSLARRFGAFLAVNRIDFAVEPGECFGLLGPNGAGKTTTIRMVACRLPPSEGELRVLGQDACRDPAAVRRQLGVVPQENQLDPSLTVLENLYTYGLFYGLSLRESRRRAQELLEFFELADRAHVVIQSLSGGMRRRVAIARALMGQPKLLILDEPSTGLDPHARRLLWDRLAELRRRGVTILLSTHYMDEAARLCDRVAVMHLGRIIAEGPPEALVRRHVGRWVVEVEGADGALAVPAAVRGRMAVGTTEYFFTDELDPEAAVRLWRGQGSVRVRPANLEDVFVSLTGQLLAGEAAHEQPDGEPVRGDRRGSHGRPTGAAGT